MFQNHSSKYIRSLFGCVTLLLLSVILFAEFAPTPLFAEDTDSQPAALDLDDDNDGILDIDECTVGAQSGGTGAVTTGVSFSISSADPNDQTVPHILDSITIGSSTFEEFIVPDALITNYGIANPLAVKMLEQGVTLFDYSSSTYDVAALPAFQSTNLNYYQQLDGNNYSTSTFTLVYDQPLLAIKGMYVVIQERQGNNSYGLTALDEFGVATGTPLATTINPDYIGTGHQVSRANSLGQEAELMIIQIETIVPVGTLIYGLEVAFPGATNDGPDGKVFVIADQQPCDTDGDGVTNDLDIDSDNDGISDLVEAGLDAATLDPDGNGIIDGAQFVDADLDGLADAVETLFGADTGAVPVDSDSDDIPDLFDLDSDNDGIPDTVEAYPTLNYSTTYGTDGDITDDDLDLDGAIGIFDADDAGVGTFGGTFFSPQNTDGTGLPDYLDTDSDDDSTLDSVESGFTLTGVDTDNNGIDDATNATYQDPNGDVNDPQTFMANEAGDTTEVGYRELLEVSLQLTKTVVGGINSAVATVGELVSYQLTISNTGTATTTNVLVIDDLLGGDITSSCTWPGVPQQLTAGEQVICLPSAYSITEVDISNGFIENTASTTATSSIGSVSDISDAGDETVETANGAGATDGDATNDPTVVIMTAPTSSHSGGGSGRILNSDTPTSPQSSEQCTVPLELQYTTCDYFTQWMQLGDRDGRLSQYTQDTGRRETITEVTKLQHWLNTYYDAELPVTGYYDEATETAVHQYQAIDAHYEYIITPWVPALPDRTTGNWYKTTRYHANWQMDCVEGARTLELSEYQFTDAVHQPFPANSSRLDVAEINQCSDQNQTYLESATYTDQILLIQQLRDALVQLISSLNR